MAEKPYKLILQGNKARAGNYLPYARAKLDEAQSIYGFPFERRYAIGPDVTIVVSGDTLENRQIRIKAGGGIFGYEFSSLRSVFSYPHFYDLLWEGVEMEAGNPFPQGYSEYLWSANAAYRNRERTPFTRYSLVSYSVTDGLIVTNNKKKPIVQTAVGNTLAAYSGDAPAFLAGKLFMHPFWSATDNAMVVSARGYQKYANGVSFGIEVEGEFYDMYQEATPEVSNEIDGRDYQWAPVIDGSATVYDFTPALAGGPVRESQVSPTGNCARYGSLYVFASRNGNDFTFTVGDGAFFRGEAGGQSMVVTVPAPSWYADADPNEIDRETLSAKVPWHFSPHSPKAVAVISYWVPTGAPMDLKSGDESHGNPIKIELRQGIYEVEFIIGTTAEGIYATAVPGRAIESPDGMLIAADYAYYQPDSIRVLRSAILDVDGGSEYGRRRASQWEWMLVGPEATSLPTPYRVIAQNDGDQRDEASVKFAYEAIIQALDLQFDAFAMIRSTVTYQDPVYYDTQQLYIYNVGLGWSDYGESIDRYTLQPKLVIARKLLVVNGVTVQDEAITVEDKLIYTSSGPPTTPESTPEDGTVDHFGPEYFWNEGYAAGGTMIESVSGTRVRAYLARYPNAFAPFPTYNSRGYYAETVLPSWRTMEFLRRPENANWISVHPDGHWSVFCGEAHNYIGGVEDASAPSQVYAWYGLYHAYKYFFRHRWDDDTQWSYNRFPVDAEEIPVDFDIVHWETPTGPINTTHRDLLAQSRPGARLRSHEVPYAFSALWFLPRTPVA